MKNNILLAVNNLGVATITLNRPEIHNAFDEELIENLLMVLKQINDDATIKLVQLTASGKSFSAGADLNWMRRMASYSYEENLQDALVLSELMATLKSLCKPTIAIIQGAVYGGGVGLVCCCDIAIASAEASFCLSEVKIGLIPAVISPYVIAVLGERAARYYALTAEVINAEEAYQIGLITKIVAQDQLLKTADNISRKILSNSPQAVSLTKQLINRVANNPYNNNHLHKNAEAIAAVRVSSEGQAGLTAFLEKRKPSWQE